MKAGGPLKRSTPLKRTGRLAPRSKKTVERKFERDEVRRIALARAGGLCQAAVLVPEVGCWHPRGKPLDVHEIAARGTHPGSQYDAEVTMAICRMHHDWVDDHSNEAVERGLKIRPTT